MKIPRFHFVSLAGKFISAALCVLFLVPSCSSSKTEASLPPPDATCPVILDWKGLIPGSSTRRDVISILGKPDRKSRELFYDWRIVPYYQYDVEGGVISDFAHDRLFFRSDGTLDWMEIIVSDRDGTFHSVRETIDRLGSSLDAIFKNDNFNPNSKFQVDILGGPDKIWIWSECGIVVLAIPCSPSRESGKLVCSK